MKTPRISVVMPVRDGGAFLEPAVASILAQDFRDLELVLVDDHSSDDAVATLDMTDPRLRVMPSEGTGVAAAANTGIAAANGEFIARMDADDVARPERLALQLDLLERRPDVDLVGGRVRIFAASPLRRGNQRYEAWLNRLTGPDAIRRAMFVENPIPNPTLMVRRDVYDRIGGYRTEIDWAEDYDWLLRADRAGLSMAKPRPVVLDWRDHDGRLTRTDPAFSSDAFMRARAHYLVSGRLPDRPLILWGAGRAGRQLHDALAGEGVRPEGFIDIHPRRIGGSKRDRPVWGIDEVAHRPEAFYIVAVGAAGARPEIRDHFESLGRTEGVDFLFAS